MKFEIKFKHLVEIEYTAYVKAESKKQAQEIFDKDPFEYVDDLDGGNEQGLEIEIESIEEADEEE